ncbi:MAG: fibro-slime domain-containing protein [Chitinispirillaceae bacterium]|nr:fibro-slime domain-containing protein [Chitinispirillaceae bacterium]
MKSLRYCIFLLFFVVISKVMAVNIICDTSYNLEVDYDTNYTPKPIKCFKIPVTYYDYHVDGSNPDFGFRVTSRWDQGGKAYANLHGWVDSTLSPINRSPQRHPSLKDTFLDISWNINRLFEPWKPGKIDTFVIKFPPIIETRLVDTLIIEVDTTYDNNGNIVLLQDTITTLILYDTIPVPDSILISDTMFKNVVIEDSLTAYWLPNEITYDDITDSMWTFGSREKEDPLNGRGFGNETDETRNAGYTFHLYNKFTYKGGEKIYFGGDDDVYMFINGRLVIECAGFHEEIIESLFLDSVRLAGVPLTINQQYEIDIFFVERRMGGNFFMGGLSEFVNKSPVSIDTFYDTLITYHFDTLGIDTIRCRSGVRSLIKTPSQKTLLGLRIPEGTKYVVVEYFSISGKKVTEKKYSLNEVIFTDNKAINISSGIYIARINFRDSRGKDLSKPAFRKIMGR